MLKKREKYMRNMKYGGEEKRKSRGEVLKR